MSWSGVQDVKIDLVQARMSIDLSVAAVRTEKVERGIGKCVPTKRLASSLAVGVSSGRLPGLCAILLLRCVPYSQREIQQPCGYR